MRRIASPLRPLAFLAVLAGCQDGTVTAPPSRSVLPSLSPVIAAVDETPVSYFAPRTIVREGSGVQTVQFTLDDHDHSLFMEPFVLSVHADGDQRIVGIVKVDGVPVLERRDLIALGGTTAPLSREVAIGPSSVVTVELQGPTGGSLRFWVDAPLQPPPVITVTSPVRHSDAADGQNDAFLAQGTQALSPVEITGSACHVRYAITHLEVAGVNVPVPGTNRCEPFTVTQQSRWGLTIITGSARNARGRVGNVVQAYVRSADYYEPRSDLISVPGFFTRLGQLTIDDGDRATVNDVATVLENHLKTLTVNVPALAAVPCTGGVFDAWITGGRAIQSLKINSLNASSAGLAWEVSVFAPYVDVRTRTDLNPFDGCDGDLNTITGRISASEVRVRASAVFENETGEVTVSVTDPSLQWSGLRIDLDNVPEGFTDPIVATAQSAIGSYIVSALTTAIESQLTGFFRDVTKAPLTVDLPLNSALLRVSGQFYHIEPGGSVPDGFVQSGMSGVVAELTQDPTARATKGPIKGLCVKEAPCTGGLAKAPPFAKTPEVGASVHQDKLNSTFWSAWRGGAFNIPDVSVLPAVGSLTALSMSAQATLPPVSMAIDVDSGPVKPLPGDEPPTFEMAWGDVRVHATYDPTAVGGPAGAPIEVDAWVSVVVRGDMAVDQKASRLVVNNVTCEGYVQLLSPVLPYADAALRAAILADVNATITSLSRSAVGVLPVKLSIDRLGNSIVNKVTREKMNYVLKGSIP